jgi:hypothetical protein
VNHAGFVREIGQGIKANGMGTGIALSGFCTGFMGIGVIGCAVFGII